MARYFFHVMDGSHERDATGVELRDLKEARRVAADLGGKTLVEGAAAFWDGQPWSVHVTDESGLALFELHLTTTSSPATMNSRDLVYQKPLG